MYISRKTAILNYNSFSGNSTASINEKKRKKECPMSVDFSKSNIGNDEAKFIKHDYLRISFSYNRSSLKSNDSYHVDRDK